MERTLRCNHALHDDGDDDVFVIWQWKTASGRIPRRNIDEDNGGVISTEKTTCDNETMASTITHCISECVSKQGSYFLSRINLVWDKLDRPTDDRVQTKMTSLPSSFDGINQNIRICEENISQKLFEMN